MRNFLYALAKLLGHLSAIKTNTIPRRAARVATGKLLGRIFEQKTPGHSTQRSDWRDNLRGVPWLSF